MFREITKIILLFGLQLFLFGLLLVILLQAVIELSFLPMLVARSLAGLGF